MKRTIGLMLIICGVLALTTLAGDAQQPATTLTDQEAKAMATPKPGVLVTTTPTPPLASPQLDEQEKNWLTIANLSEQLAYSECQRLESVQRFNSTLADVLKKIEERHPGYTIDRAKGALVASAKR